MAKSSKASKLTGGRGAKRAYANVAAPVAHRDALTGSFPMPGTTKVEVNQLRRPSGLAPVTKTVKVDAPASAAVLHNVQQTLKKWLRVGRIERASEPVLSTSGRYHDIDVSLWIPAATWYEDRYDDLMDELSRLGRQHVTVSPHVYPYSGERAS